ncbi:retropepsin-like aspartic protease [Xanthomonas sp. NCPPB 2632]|uniref:retropepsin-like aspartic protease n=1 Tax=Xanthomonas sp. NCPPB 2632 TaxID=3240912 RepID=UPI0035174E80
MKRSFQIGMSVTLLASACALSATTYVRPSDNGTISSLVYAGNVEALRALQSKSQDPLFRLYIDALVDRAELRADASATASRTCYDKAIDKSTNIVLAAACAELTAGTLSIQGRRAERDAFAKSARSRIYPLLSDQLKRPDIAIRSLEGDAGPAKQSAFRVEHPPKSTVAWANPGELPAGGRYLSVTSKGRSVVALFDTGNQRTILNQSDAKALGARDERNVVVTMPSAEGLPKSVKGSVAVLPSIGIGDVQLENVEVFVTDVPMSVVGLDLILRIYGAFKLDDKGLHPYDARRSTCALGNLDMGGHADGIGVGLVAKLLVNDRWQSVFVDTGNSDTLDDHTPPSSDPAQASSIVEATTLAGRSRQHFGWSQMTLSSDSKPFTVTVRQVDSPKTLANYVLGNGFLASGALDFNLQGHSLCLTDSLHGSTQ